ncbi:MAG: hypothetical protein M3R24_00230 [Chloroflexota bacterium]|nr:hypothetical protein [Chloroflexota bacterium]
MQLPVPNAQRLRELGEQLEHLGFYRYTQPRHIPRLKAIFAKTGSLLDERTHRDYVADAERLAECGVAEFLGDVAPFLKAQSIELEHVEEACTPQSYRITVNGTQYVLYSATELNAHIASNGMTTNIWELAARRTCALLNKLLIEQGADERAFSLYGGNDHWVLFLTEALYEILCQSGVVEEVQHLHFYGPSELQQS